MAEQKLEKELVDRFEAHRDHLRRVAHRMLGSVGEADDAVQEAWLRLSRSESGAVDNLGGWLTTVVARVCLDMLRTRKSRGEEPAERHAADLVAHPGEVAEPERELLLADSVGVALLVVLGTLAPAERVAFVLHDMFDLSFDAIAPIVGRSAVATRQLASRARRRVQLGRAASDADLTHQQALVGAFLAAARDGDFQALLAALDPDVVLHADGVAVAAAVANRSSGAPPLAPEVRGAAAVAQVFRGRARGAQPALVNGAAGAVWAPGGEPRAIFAFVIAAGKIVEVEVIADPARIAEHQLRLLGQ
ncbi:MAG TPA: sigma-70 family RNA polymerase sigma factor [Polyangia bacterium]|jgi:RNA polymerase sigma-70 factor (ECF subfamily)|nr:sigma-70 family RNA polymerase sigma factor [Polyangia bacterium]